LTFRRKALTTDLHSSRPTINVPVGELSHSTTHAVVYCLFDRTVIVVVLLFDRTVIVVVLLFDRTVIVVVLLFDHTPLNCSGLITFH
jgi:hypothetical protein